MSDTNVPFGWNDRKNGTYILPDAPPAGDWRAHNLIDKYKASGDNSTDPSLPFGWNDRINTKTVEELSLSMDSTNVAVAEVNLVDLERAKEQKLQEAVSGKSNVDNGAVVAVLQPQLNSLKDTVSLLDTRLQSVETNIATIMKQQEMIINLLIQQSNSRINDSQSSS